jgi:rhodanese-related sulfurtransferase
MFRPALPQPQTITAPALQRWLQGAEPPLLVDVREPQELALAALPEVVHLPLSASQQWLPQLQDRLPAGRDLVVLCHAGIRSWQFACWLMETQGRERVWNLEGGIDAWSLAVDSAVPRY